MEEQEGRIVAMEEQSSDDWQYSLRPRKLKEYIGQDEAKENLSVFIQAALKRGEALDHVLLYGPPGLGKTTLAAIIANELGVNFRVTSGPAIENSRTLAEILTNLEKRDVLFIDEIHRLSRSIEEVLYSAMEDFALDIIIGKGPGARSIRLDIAPFTLVGATTRWGALAAPLRDRFGVPLRLEYYRPEALKEIIKRAAEILKIRIEDAGAIEIARRSRGTPRVANRLLKRVRDFAQINGDGVITEKLADEALVKLEVDKAGLDRMDRRLLTTMIKKVAGGPVGLETLAAAISEETDTITDVYEPFLIQLGFLMRTPRGRIVTRVGYEHMNIPYPSADDKERAALSLFDESQLESICVKMEGGYIMEKRVHIFCGPKLSNLPQQALLECSRNFLGMVSNEPITGEVEGLTGVRLDFNVGWRLQIPSGNWHVNIRDGNSGIVCFDGDVSDILLVSA